MANFNEHEAIEANYMSVPEAARYLGVGRKVMYQLIEYNRVRAVRRRQVLMVERRSLEEFQRTKQLT